MQQEQRNKIVEKIAKLLALANDPGATEAESRLAMSRAKNLMLQYGLSVSEVERQKASGTVGVTKVYLRTKTYPRYAGILAFQLDKVFGNVGFYQSGKYEPNGKACNYIIGRELNRSLSAHFLVSLLRQVDRLSAKKQRATGWGRSAMFDYRIGLVQGILIKVRELFQDKAQENGGKSPGSPGAFGLIVSGKEVLVREAESYCLQKYGFTPGTGSGGELRKSTARDSGMTDGGKVSVSRPVGTSGGGVQLARAEISFDIIFLAYKRKKR